ncbi:hypothetical protein FQA47_019463 [Oryzias melastigma]|uniref:Uncharacterized protein n=1 Tax=Oryzias melastigma TaxID=30732 RepID=A0A834CBI0_ORYME|nr:hypothetical protein FQA47_019463 [Oryzias melastigma]
MEEEEELNEDQHPLTEPSGLVTLWRRSADLNPLEVPQTPRVAVTSNHPDSAEPPRVHRAGRVDQLRGGGQAWRLLELWHRISIIVLVQLGSVSDQEEAAPSEGGAILASTKTPFPAAPPQGHDPAWP